MKKLLIMAGGTGGHIMPGLAVAERMELDGWKIAWMGSPDGMEARLTAGRGFETAWIRFSALRGKGLFRKLLLPINLLRAFYQAFVQLGQIKPDLVLGFGGYISFPGGMMAVLRGIPLILHEQNSVAGLANRVLALVANRVLTGFPNVIKRGEWVGNPVRPEISNVARGTNAAPAQRYAGRQGSLRVLILGGSLGARALNEIAPRALALTEPNARPLVIHQTGAIEIDTVKKLYSDLQVQAQCVPFITDMARTYAEADLVICQAGALTIAELAAVGVASLLVPFPAAVDDHQTTNAQFLARAGAAFLLPQFELSPDRLMAISTVSREQLAQMAEKAYALAMPNASDAVARHCSELCKESANET
jgi:UDP-N-acetylglucosamine--N-acetylmuramyl-(pentapeptide) pyrophosphoryl-undecaprenol N-acetylglucosamine transferase